MSKHVCLLVNRLKTCVDSEAHSSLYYEALTKIISLDELKFINDLFSIIHTAKSSFIIATTKIGHCFFRCHKFFLSTISKFRMQLPWLPSSVLNLPLWQLMYPSLFFGFILMTTLMTWLTVLRLTFKFMWPLPLGLGIYPLGHYPDFVYHIISWFITLFWN